MCDTVFDPFCAQIQILFVWFLKTTLGNHATHTGGTTEGHVLLDTESSANERLGALGSGTDEALAMPVDVAPDHALIGRSDGLLTIFASHCEEPIIALQAKGHIGVLVGYVLLAGQGLVALVAAEVLNVEGGSLGCRVLLGEDQLVTGTAARNLQFDSQVATTIHLALVEEVDQVGQQLATCGT